MCEEDRRQHEKEIESAFKFFGIFFLVIIILFFVMVAFMENKVIDSRKAGEDVGYKIGYEKGQVDALEGNIKFKKITETRYVETQPSK